MYSNFSENVKITSLFQGAANAISCDVINMEQFHHGAFVCIHTGSTDVDLVLSVYEATTVAAGTNRAIQVDVPLYVDTDMGTTSDTLIEQTAAKTYTINTTSAGDREQMVVFEVSADALSDTYPCCYLADSGGSASNIVSIFWLGEPRYKSKSLPSAIA